MKREYYYQSKIILQPGQLVTHAWYIESGSAVGFVYDGEEKTPFWFWNAGEFMIPFNSFFNQLEAKFYIEIQEPSTVLSISYQEMEEMMTSFPESDDYIHRILRDVDVDVDEEEDVTPPVPEEPTGQQEALYHRLIKHCPEVFKKISAESIANYLGISVMALEILRTKTGKA